VEDVAVEEENGAKRLVLRGGRDFLLACKVSDKLSDFGDAHFLRVTFVMKEDVVFNPEEVGVFGTGGVVFDAKHIAVLVEEFFSIRGNGIGSGHFVASRKEWVYNFADSMLYRASLYNTPHRDVLQQIFAEHIVERTFVL
jgi:hypothetical protein